MRKIERYLDIKIEIHIIGQMNPTEGDTTIDKQVINTPLSNVINQICVLIDRRIKQCLEVNRKIRKILGMKRRL